MKMNKISNNSDTDLSEWAKFSTCSKQLPPFLQVCMPGQLPHTDLHKWVFQSIRVWLAA
jgi:hypothetical protein